MNCPHCQSTNPPRLTHVLPTRVECTDCKGDVTAEVCANAVLKESSARQVATQLICKEEAEHEMKTIMAILADPHKVMLNMLHGTIAWTPETLRRVLGPDPVRAALEYLLDCTEEPPSPNCSCHINPPCHDCVDFSGLRDAIAGAKKALTDTEPK